MAPDTGPVADMVRQFADPHAFLRELIQNGIDAGATSIGVRIDLAGGVSTTEVTDNGCGMSRAVIEGPLITLFSSSKEGDSSKIGKYGVGFVSVFAIDPERVEVETWRDGEAWTVHFYRDHSYELAEASPRSGSGTRVALIRAMDSLAFDEHVMRSTLALERWCRHASCPIDLVAANHDRGQPAQITRINRALLVRAAVWVKAADDNGDEFVVGPSAGSTSLEVSADGAGALEHRESFAGFYNRGLTLYETAEELSDDLCGLRFKVLSSSLKHTLSRDNVRRDDAFKRVVGRIRDLAGKPLRRELATRLREAAEDYARGKNPKTYVALLEAALLEPMNLPGDEVMLPLAHPLGGKRTIRLSSYRRGKPPLAAESSNALARAITSLGKPVLLLSSPLMDSFLSGSLAPGPLSMVERAFLLIDELPRDALEPGDRKLCDAVHTHLLETGAEVTRVGIGKVVEGAAGGAPGEPGPVALTVPDGATEAPALCPISEAHSGWRTGGTLLLDETHPVVEAARRRAQSDPRTAGHLLARILLLEHGLMSAKDSDRLLSLAAARRR